MREPACLESTSGCMLPRILPTASWYSPKTLPNSSIFCLVSPSPPALPRFCRMSRKTLVSLPRRKATSGLISSPTSRAEAFLAIRCVNITNWLAATISRAEAPACSFRAATCSVSSSMVAFFSSISATLLPSATRFFSCASTACASLSVVSQRWLRASRRGRTSSGEAGTLTPLTSPPLLSWPSSNANFSRDSRNWAKAAGLPCSACEAALARRCDSMRISPEAAT